MNGEPYEEDDEAEGEDRLMEEEGETQEIEEETQNTIKTS